MNHKAQNIIPYGRQEITEEDIKAVIQTLQSDFLTQGPAIAEFENAFAKYVGAKYAVAVANGTAALHLCAIALGINEGDRVLTTPITFAASANCIRYCGGEVDFVDIDPDTLLIDLDKLEQKLASKPIGYYSGVIPVDFAGYPVNLERLKKLANQFKIWIIEDACHAPGGYFVDSKGEKQNCGNGQYADLAIFSFHPVKHIATGEGGMVTTNDKELFDKISLLRTHGITRDPNRLTKNDGGWYYEMQELGYNYRLSDMQASLGISQLNRADKGLERRKKIASIYDQAFYGNERIKIHKPAHNVGHAYHLYIIEVKDRKGLYDFLKLQNIFPQIHYIPVHLMPYYRQFGWKENDMPVAEEYYKGCISLPMFPSLTIEEQEFVIRHILTFVN